MNSHDKVVSNDVFKEEFCKAVHNSGVLESDKAVNHIKSTTGVRVGKVKRLYVGIGKMDVVLEDENRLVEAIYTYPLVAQDMMISFLPKGTEHTHNGLHYIRPNPDLYVNVLHSSNDEYVVLGFNRRSSNESAVKGEISIKYGQTQITITDRYVSVNTEHLFINGSHHEGYDEKRLVDAVLKKLKESREKDDNNGKTQGLEDRTIKE